jgi:hypothetical protein
MQNAQYALICRVGLDMLTVTEISSERAPLSTIVDSYSNSRRLLAIVTASRIRMAFTTNNSQAIVRELPLAKIMSV